MVVYGGRPMRAVTFQAPGEVLVQEVPEPELQHPQDALIRVEASGICGSDLHIYHGRTPVEPGFTIGHEFVGTVLAVGSDVERAGVGDRVLGCFHTACGRACPVSGATTTGACADARSGTAPNSAIFREHRPSCCSCHART